MAKFFVQADQIKDKLITITGSDVRHISRVLRLKPGDQINAADGKGREYTAELKKIGLEEVTAEILDILPVRQEPAVEVFLLQGLPKGEKFDFIIQKCTEIGVKRIIPLSTERSIVRLTREKEEKRRERWQRVASEAAKQSGRGAIPEISRLMDLEQALRLLPPDTLLLMPWEGEEQSGLKEVLRRFPGACRVAFAIGPEGGFSQEEVELARKAGALTVSLGPRILRTETAGMVTLSLILYELDDLGGRRIE